MRLRNPVALSCRIVVVMLLVAAVATVLITPDTADDVHALVRSHRVMHAPILPFAFSTSIIMLVAGRFHGSPAADPGTPHLLQLLCTCRC